MGKVAREKRERVRSFSLLPGKLAPGRRLRGIPHASRFGVWYLYARLGALRGVSMTGFAND